jgi:hypothetical protein
MALHPHDCVIIQSSSRAYVEKTLSGLRRFTKDFQWVGKSNAYCKDVIAKIGLDSEAHRIRNPRHLSQYIAASCLLHCTDGWSYLGKAIASLLRGDPHRCRHLAYYAELRAAMALLATEGIGIFNNTHFVIDAPNSVTKLRRNYNTHRFAWDCLDCWGHKSTSGDLFAKVVRPYGRSLEDWLAPVGGASVAAPHAKEWLRQWGMDLKFFSGDRDARNVSSYRPDGLPDAWQIDAPAALNFVRDVWSSFEPAPGSQFETIDRNILRMTLEGLFKGQTGTKASDERGEFTLFASRVVQHQALSTAIEKQWTEFLTRQTTPNDLSILTYSQQIPGALENSHAAIVSRAALLLRVASGSAAQLVQESGFAGEAIAFWWEGIGHGRGLWEGERGANGLLDLWADIEPLLHDIGLFQEKHSAAKQTFFRVAQDLGHVLVGLSSCERVAIWSMTPQSSAT